MNKAPTTTAKNIRKFLDLCAARTDYRAVPWEFDKADIKLLCAYSRALCSGSTIELSDTQDRAMHTLTHGLDHAYIRISHSHENEGLAWLWSQYKKGWLGNEQLRIMRRFSHFTFAGVSTEKLGAYTWASVPVWRVHGDDGMFSYEQWAWQSGRKPRIV